MPVATSIVMDVLSFAWSRAVSLRVGALKHYKHTMIVFWNSTYIAVAIAHLRATEQSVPHAWLAETSPLSWEHISFSGDFLAERAAATADKRRPLNLGQSAVFHP
jgi:Tn3 transposase DDE domain